jgi:hypothetical protein
MRDRLLNLSISDEAKKLIEDATPMGKTMRFISVIFDIDNDKILSDIYLLAQFRKDNI